MVGRGRAKSKYGVCIAPQNNNNILVVGNGDGEVRASNVACVHDRVRCAAAAAAAVAGGILVSVFFFSLSVAPAHAP